jgi:hypothetical protein
MLRPAWLFAGLSLAWAIVGVAIAIWDASWIAFGIAILYGPVGNLAIGTTGTASLAWHRRRNPGSRIGLSALVLWGCALASTALIYFAISCIQLHGC